MNNNANNATGVGGVVTVVVRRDGRGWVAEAAAFGVIRARTLHTVVRLARELMAGAGSAEPIEYQFHTGDAELDRLVIQIRAAITVGGHAILDAGTPGRGCRRPRFRNTSAHQLSGPYTRRSR